MHSCVLASDTSHPAGGTHQLNSELAGNKHHTCILCTAAAAHTVALCDGGSCVATPNTLSHHCPHALSLGPAGVFRATRMRLNPRQRAAHALFKTYMDVVHVDKEEGDKLFKQRTGATVSGSIVMHEIIAWPLMLLRRKPAACCTGRGGRQGVAGGPLSHHDGGGHHGARLTRTRTCIAGMLGRQGASWLARSCQ